MAGRRNEQFKLENNQVIVNSEVAACIFGVSTRTMGDWARKGCPKIAKDTYNVREVMEWRFDSKNSPESLEAKKQRADIRYREARADMEEIKQKAAIGEYVAVNQIEDLLKETFAQVRTTLLTIGQKTMADIYAQYPDVAFDVKHVIEREIDRGLTQLASGSGQLTDGQFKAKPKPKRGRQAKSK